ncbi:MAG: RHS repeat-associated core domain-containing protein [Chloroflexaceae bacterium]|nr:RHS repeat-associated core domain-containing protein [Chloroflexaceae bacterium]
MSTAPLSQVLSDGSTTTYDGLDRLAAVGPTGTDWYLADAIGSVRLTLDDAGVPVDPSGYSYTPFGVPQSGAIAEPFGFTGEVHSIETGLVYLRARWYDPASGTFLIRDPSRQEQHLYQYARSNPINRVDPSGWLSRPEVMIQAYFESSPLVLRTGNVYFEAHLKLASRNNSGNNVRYNGRIDILDVADSPVSVGFVYEIEPVAAAAQGWLKRIIT